MSRKAGTELARPLLVAAALLGALGLLAAALPATQARARFRKHRPRALLVGTYRHHRGRYRSIQAAVDAARPGDWVLVAPGDWHERADHRRKRGPQPDDSPAGMIVAKPRIHLRGMNRRRVVVDGTRRGKGRACSTKRARQDFGVKGGDGRRLGRNGILVWKSNGVSVENLTVCNFLG